jgi:hypothetical protein
MHYSSSTAFTNLAKDGVYDSSPYVRAITSYTTRMSTVIGGMYCKYGNTTGYGCGTLQSRTAGDLSWIPNCARTYLEISATYTINMPGDSGGPVYNGSSAVGSAIGGRNGTTLIAMSMDGYVPDLYVRRG